MKSFEGTIQIPPFCSLICKLGCLLSLNCRAKSRDINQLTWSPYPYNYHVHTYLSGHWEFRTPLAHFLHLPFLLCRETRKRFVLSNRNATAMWRIRWRTRVREGGGYGATLRFVHVREGGGATLRLPRARDVCREHKEGEGDCVRRLWWAPCN